MTPCSILELELSHPLHAKSLRCGNLCWASKHLPSAQCYTRQKHDGWLCKQAILDNDLQNTTLVGHSLAGVWMQLLLQQIPERIGMMIFIDAVALEPGESFFSNQIAGLLPTYPVYPSQARS